MAQVSFTSNIQGLTNAEWSQSIGGGNGSSYSGGSSGSSLSPVVAQKLTEMAGWFAMDEDGNVYLTKDENDNARSFYAYGAVTAGGVGSGGSGGSGAMYLLADVTSYNDTKVGRDTSTPAQSGDILAYDGTKWHAIEMPATGVTSVTMNGSTQTGAVDLGTVITSLAGYATESWVGQQGYITSSALAPYVKSVCSQTPDNNGNVTLSSANLTDASSIAYQAAGNNFIAHGNEFNFIPSAFGGTLYINYRTTGGQNGSISTYYIFNGGGSYASLSASGFIHTSYTSSAYVLTGDGGAAAISGLSVANATNAVNATYATYDASGNAIASTYLPLSGGTLSSTLTISSSYAADIELTCSAGTGSIVMHSVSGYGMYIINRISNDILRIDSGVLTFNGHDVLNQSNYGNYLGSVYHPYGGSSSVALSCSTLTANNAYMKAFYYDSSNGCWFGYTADAIGSGTGATIWAYGDSPIHFFTNGTERMTINSSGVGIGTSSPAQKLEVNGLIKTSAIYLAGGTRIYHGLFTDAQISGGSSADLWLYTDGHLFMCGNGVRIYGTSLSVDGNITANGAITAGSDLRWKENIESVDASAISKLNPVQWDWKEGHGEGHSAGLIAQQVAEVIPYAVFGDEEKGYTLNYNVFHAFEISALQTHETEIEHLRRQVAELKLRIQQLEQ